VSPYDSAATKARLLDAAFGEFVQFGLAGARVDRIAAAAHANKQAIYAYFGSKEALFDAVLAERLGVLADAIPFTPHDLPGYAVAYFDYILTHPEHMRMAMWRRLERPNATDAELAAYGGKIAAIATTLRLDPKRAAPLDVLLIVLGAAMAWAMAVPGIRDADAAAIKRQRLALRTSVAASVSALTK
jgi:AcrR family transcriptional regulator